MLILLKEGMIPSKTKGVGVNYIKVTTEDGEVFVNRHIVEMVFKNEGGCTLRMNEKLFVKVLDPIEIVLEKLNQATGGK